MQSITGTVLAASGSSGYDQNGNDFDILRDLLITADKISPEPFGGIGLVAALDTVPNLTAFAPNDNAFRDLASSIAGLTGNKVPAGEAQTIAFLADTLTLLGKGDASGLLTEILTYHVTPGEFRLADVVALGDGAAVPTLQGKNLKTDLDTTPPSIIDRDNGVRNPGIIATDIEASNGVIHVIDGVLLPVAVSSILSKPGTDLKIGNQGTDYFSTGMGNDFVDGNGGRDIMWLGSGNDVAIGGEGNDWISGGRGVDTLLGESGQDKIYGGSGQDTIDGGAGGDWIAGGSGSDVFVFKHGSNRDTIVDYQDGNDKFDLSGYSGIDGFDDLTVREGWLGTRIELDDGDSITLVGVRKGQIDAGDFMFADTAVA
ncbi:fasciclin domain-containing protein [Rhizobiaceae bacterium n13]|uniref:fasciclin domain-containing protein n=1 Tax=Ferirhizobium litorale TaxID=2927786 RepID=UPI0024B29D9E|nr:fasciclin domain-containing protein [Fererhizobium litorale]MDI7864955.1 fasciclin domain-containing protein [Fererhizobium litorale]